MAIPHIGELKNYEKRAITPRRVIRFISKFRSTNKYGRQGQFLFLIGYCLKKSSHLKLLGKMDPNLAGSIYVRSSNMKKLTDGRRMPSDGNTSL
jgi:hypothetical protein